MGNITVPEQAILREPHQKHHEGIGGQLAFGTRFCGPSFDYQQLLMIGDFLLHRLISCSEGHLRGMPRRPRIIPSRRLTHHLPFQTVCHSTTTFITDFPDQCIAHEWIALQVLVLFLERPPDNLVNIAIGFTREVGAFLQENSP